jgi:isocitrate dehydrogenase
METPKGSGMKSINVTARKVWSTYANKRVFKTLPGVETVFSKAGIHIDLTIVRENIEDTYGGVEHMQTHDVAQCRRFITRPGSLQVHRKAFEIAMGKEGTHRVTCCHKANIMKLTDGLFLETFHEVAKNFPDIRTDDIIVDDLAMKLVTRPDLFDVVVLPNLQGDIMSDLAAGLVGGLGMAPSANIGDDIAIFEAVHGTAPDIAGKGIANPTALILSSAMMLRHLGLHDRADMIESGLHAALAAGIRTGDLTQADGMTPASTGAFVEGIIKHLPPAAANVPINIPLELRPVLRPQPTENEVLVSPKKEVVTVGADIFVESELAPSALAAAIQGVAPEHLKLTMISNRGTQVWPTGSVLTQCVNHYRCRVEFVDSSSIKPEAARQDLLKSAALISSPEALVCSLEMLNIIDGKQGFTLAQGQ